MPLQKTSCGSQLFFSGNQNKGKKKIKCVQDSNCCFRYYVFPAPIRLSKTRKYSIVDSGSPTKRGEGGPGLSRVFELGLHYTLPPLAVAVSSLAEIPVDSSFVEGSGQCFDRFSFCSNVLFSSADEFRLFFEEIMNLIMSCA